MNSETSVVVRQATAEDWRTWRELRLRALQDSPGAFGSTYAREAAFTEADWRRRAGGSANAAASGDGTSGPAVLAFVDKVPVGIGGGYRDLPGWLHVVAMWTDPVWRGHGVGRAVIDWIAGWARQNGLRLHLDVETDNAGARRLYESCGFVATGETRPLREGSDRLVERMVLPG